MSCRTWQPVPLADVSALSFEAMAETTLDIGSLAIVGLLILGMSMMITVTCRAIRKLGRVFRSGGGGKKTVKLAQETLTRVGY